MCNQYEKVPIREDSTTWKLTEKPVLSQGPAWWATQHSSACSSWSVPRGLQLSHFLLSFLKSFLLSIEENMNKTEGSWGQLPILGNAVLCIRCRALLFRSGMHRASPQCSPMDTACWDLFLHISKHFLRSLCICFIVTQDTIKGTDVVGHPPGLWNPRQKDR